MLYNYQYKVYPTQEQKLVLNSWLRTCRYWYNKMLGERFNWWKQNRSYIDRCNLICHLPELKNNPRRFSQQAQLPGIKKDLVKINWSGEHKNFKSVPANTLQEVCKRVDKAFKRYISGDSKGNRSGKPRFKNEKR